MLVHFLKFVSVNTLSHVYELLLWCHDIYLGVSPFHSYSKFILTSKKGLFPIY